MEKTFLAGVVVPISNLYLQTVEFFGNFCLIIRQSLSSTFTNSPVFIYTLSPYDVSAGSLFLSAATEFLSILPFKKTLPTKGTNSEYWHCVNRQAHDQLRACAYGVAG